MRSKEIRTIKTKDGMKKVRYLPTMFKPLDMTVNVKNLTHSKESRPKHMPRKSSGRCTRMQRTRRTRNIRWWNLS